MKKRPVSVTVVSCLLAATGALGLAFHLADFKAIHSIHSEVIWISLVRLIDIVCGVFMLRGSNWARWVAMAWIGFHVAISFYNSLQQVAIHGVLFLVFGYFLFRPDAAAFFRTGRNTETGNSAPQSPSGAD